MNPEIEQQAKLCDGYAKHLEQLESQLHGLRQKVAEGWKGTGGDSLCEELDLRVKAVRRAQAALRTAAGTLRSAAASVPASR